MIHLIIDTDSLIYRAGFSAEGDSVEKAFDVFDSIIVDCVRAADCDTFSLYLTGTECFRSKLATLQEYKGSRKGKPRPEHYDALRKHAKIQWQAFVVQWIEADDACIMEAEETKRRGDTPIVCHIDKDLDQWAGLHMNPNRLEDGIFEITEQEAMLSFYTQLLTGDKTDDIPGLSKKAPERGIGPATAKKLLFEHEDQSSCYATVLAAYHDRYGEVHDYVSWRGKAQTKSHVEILQENADLLYLKRSDGDRWSPPV